jgi:hypothetical protein
LVNSVNDPEKIKIATGGTVVHAQNVQINQVSESGESKLERLKKLREKKDGNK